MSSDAAGPPTNYGNLAKLIYIIVHLFIFKLVVMVALTEPLEELKEIIHMKAAITMMIMFTVQSFQKMQLSFFFCN